MKENSPRAPAPDCAGRRCALVVARFYPELADELIDGATRALRECAVAEGDICRFDAPGCFELPLLCAEVIETNRFD
ncbi:MAG TPA: 6,7-dimethyl-8-ribityllumazine synthase, partial [Candidatus Nitrosotalea sp.]|nr:6,7-dimethyl-8-ribityllumazine synthase [Candidatus Nitrosotalea sp.]